MELEGAGRTEKRVGAFLMGCASFLMKERKKKTKSDRRRENFHSSIHRKDWTERAKKEKLSSSNTAAQTQPANEWRENS